MVDLEMMKELFKNPDGAMPSVAAVNIIEALESDLSAPVLSVSASSCPQCGNGNTGSGFPGERQVNDPAQDTPVFPHITQSETSIATFGQFILFGFNDSNRIAPPDRSLDGVAFSSDSGVTWCDCGSLPRGNFQGLFGDPVIAVDSQGIFYYASLANSPTGESVISVSIGQVDPMTRVLTMGNPITVGTGQFANGFQDKEWIAVGPDKSRAGNQALYVTWTDFKPAPLNTATIRFSKFTTGANPVQLIASKDIVLSSVQNFNPVQGSFPVVDSNGDIFVFYSAFDPAIPFPNERSVRMVKSVDGGANFTDPIIVASPVTAASNNITACNRPAIHVDTGRDIRTNEFPHAAVAPDGTLYAVWNDGKNLATTGIDIFLAFSTNGGLNWNVRQITNTTTHEFFPSVIVHCGNAQIQYSRFNDPQGVGGVGNGTFALFKKSFSIANGLSPETMVSTVFSPVPLTNPNFDNFINNCYMGDYNQIIAGPGNALYHAWGDNRFILEGENNPDVFFIQTECVTATRGLDIEKVLSIGYSNSFEES